VSTQELARGVEARLGRAVFVSAAEGDLSVEGRIEPAHGKPGWRALLVLRDSKGAQLGTRELTRDEASCEAMREPLVLVIALMIDPDAATSSSKRSPPPPPSPPQTIVVEKQVPVYVNVPVEAPRAPDPPTWHFDAGASLATSLGLFGGPGPGLGGYVSGLLEPPGFIPLEGYGALWVDPTSEGGPTFSLAYVGAGLCPLRYREGMLAAYACASGQLGYLRPSASSSAQLYAAGALEGRLSVRVLGPIAARAGFSFVVPVVKMSSPVAATMDAGLGVILP